MSAMSWPAAARRSSRPRMSRTTSSSSIACCRSLDGLSLVKAVRAAGVKVPALFLTAIGGVDDRVEGLEAGGDDYLVKPFAFSELLARVNALARRPPVQEQKTVLRTADLELDSSSGR